MSASPASPVWRIRSVLPLDVSNSRFTSSEMTKESCVTSTTSFDVAATAAGDECDREDGDREDGAGGVQHAAIEVHAASSVSGPGRMARRMPFPTAMRAVFATNSFETPRLEPGSSVSPASG